MSRMRHDRDCGLRIANCGLRAARGQSLRNRSRFLRRAFGMAETALSVVIVGVMLVAALKAVGVSRSGQINISDRARGELLARALMEEIMRQAYREPTDTPLFGLEGAEIGSINRLLFDDVDDYDGLTNSTPQYRDGTTIPNATGWTRSVTVVYVNPSNFNQTSITDSGAKRITITVAHNNVTVATLVAVRMNHNFSFQ